MDIEEHSKSHLKNIVLAGVLFPKVSLSEKRKEGLKDLLSFVTQENEYYFTQYFDHKIC